MPIKLNINGQVQAADALSEMRLLWVKRDFVAPPDTKFSCGVGQCDACTMLVNGKVTRGCVTPLSTLNADNMFTFRRLVQNGVPSGALYNKTTLAALRTQQGNFDWQRILVLQDTPKIEVQFIASDAAPAGVCEPSTPPIFAAATNTVFAASGARYWSLLRSNHGLA